MTSITTMTTPQIWQLSWNSKNYMFEERLQAACANNIERSMLQSWGRSSVTNIDKIKRGDIIYISCAKNCIAKATIIESFHQFSKVQNDQFIKNQVEHDDRHGNRWYCRIHLDEIYFGKHRRELRGNQNTFCKPKNAFWAK